MSPIKPLLILLFSLLLGRQMALAAACCGGGFAAPSLITGDDQGQLTTSYSFSQVVDEVGNNSMWYPQSNYQYSQTYKIEGAHILADQWQAGFSLPLVSRSMNLSSSSGLGDVSGTLGYEFLPDWDYNPWRPRGLGFVQITLPTGRSVNESTEAFQLDSRGRGFYALGIGTLLTKIIHKWDIFVELDIHHSFPKDYSNSQSHGTVSPGQGGNLGGGVGFNLSAWRLGTGLTWTYEDPIGVAGTINSPGAAQQLATATLSASCMIGNVWTTSLVYSDQTLFGSPLNSSLGRGFAISVTRRWERE